MNNAAFNIQLTLRTTGSLVILDKTGPNHDKATCQILSQNSASKGGKCNSVLGDYTHFASCKLSGYHCRPHKVLEDVVLECFKDTYVHSRAKALAQMILTEDTRTTEHQAWDITEDDEALGRFNQPDLLLIRNGVLPDEEFQVTSKRNPRKLNANSITD